MKNKKQKRIWAGLLLTGFLALLGRTAVWAYEGSEGEWINDEHISENDTDTIDVSGEDGGVPDGAEAEVEADHDISGKDTVSGDSVSNQEEETADILSDNEMEEAKENVLSSNETNGEKVLSDNKGTNAEEQMRDDRPMEVILPTDISFEMMPVGSEGIDGMITSRQFCIENQGDEEVRISILGRCLGMGSGEYAVLPSSTANDYVAGKKNLWLYLQWEDEERQPLDQPGIVMGGALNPGTGEIILKAPGKSKKGSKAYFSFKGDMKSDTGQGWKDNEVKVELSVSIE